MMQGFFNKEFNKQRLHRILKKEYDSIMQYIMMKDIHNNMLFVAPKDFGVERIIVRVLTKSGAIPFGDTGIIRSGNRWFRLLIFTKGGRVLLKGEDGKDFIGIMFGRQIDRWVKFAVMKKIFERKEMNGFAREYAEKCMNLEAIRELSLLWMSWKCKGGNSFKRFADASPRLKVLRRHLKLNRYHRKKFSNKLLNR